QQIETFARERRLRGRGVAHPVDGIAFETQRAAQAFADHPVVFDEQQSHPKSITRCTCVPGDAVSCALMRHLTRSMPKALRNTLLSMRDLLVTAGPFIVIALLLLVLAYFALDPNPPRKVVLATGAEQGAYDAFGKRYVAWLKQHDITVVTRTTQGAAENLALLRDPNSGVDL